MRMLVAGFKTADFCTAQACENGAGKKD